MAFRMSEMTVLRSTDSKKFASRMRAVIAKHFGRVAHIAQDLDVGETTVKRWLREDVELQARATKARAKRARFLVR